MVRSVFLVGSFRITYIYSIMHISIYIYIMGSMTPTAPMAHMNPIMSIFLVMSFRIDSMNASKFVARCSLQDIVCWEAPTDSFGGEALQ